MSITIKHGSKKNIPVMKQLWREAFGDSEEFIDTFFTKFYRPSRAFLAFEDGELVSMLYYMDVKAKCGKKRLKTAYLYGVATKLSERRRGHFRLLHNAFLDEVKNKRYDAVLVMPADDTLFGFYKDFGYTVSLKRFEYRLLTQELEEVFDAEEVWNAKKEVYKHSNPGLQILETLEQFKVSREEHKFFRHGSSYLSFAPTSSGYLLYEVVNPSGEYVPVEQIHYERSAQLYDINSVLDTDLLEKQKPALSYLLN